MQKNSDVGIIRLLIEEYPLSLTVSDSKGYSPLELCSRLSDLTFFFALKNLLTPKVVTNIQDGHGTLPIFIRFLAHKPMKNVSNDFTGLESLNKCFCLLLTREPEDFQTKCQVASALKSLPLWLQKYLGSRISWIYQEQKSRGRKITNTFRRSFNMQRLSMDSNESTSPSSILFRKSLGSVSLKSRSTKESTTKATISNSEDADKSRECKYPNIDDWRKPIPTERSDRQVC